jgi:tetratricopeptide (TPR) repeat protein
LSTKIKTSRYQKLVLFLFGFSLFVVLEMALRVFGIPDRTKIEDPFIGFEKVYSLFGEKENSEGHEICYINPNKLSFFNYQEFEKSKPENTFRIFCFGGSTTFGRPFNGKTAFPLWLQEKLNLIDPEKKYEVINVGGISYASYRLVHLAEEVLKYQPDMFIIYSGHNEFLEVRTYERLLEENKAGKNIKLLLNKFNIYLILKKIIFKIRKKTDIPAESGISLESEVATILDESAGFERYSSKNLHIKETLQHYRFNIEQIIKLAEENNVRIILSTVASNIKDFSPFKSQHAETLSDSNLTKWTNYYQEGQLFQKQKKYSQALVVFQKCLSIDNQYAELLFRIGQCMDKLNQYDLAKRYFVQAKEMDIVPLRALSEINSYIRELGRKYVIPVIDISKEFELRTPHQILDGMFIIDHVHPTVQGNQIIAEAITQVLVERKIVPQNNDYKPSQLSVRYKNILDSLPSDYYVNGSINLAKVLGWAGKEKEKKAILDRNSDKLQNSAEYFYMDGNSMLRSGKLPEAVAQFKKAISLNPNFPGAHTNLGFSLEQSGSLSDALENYKKALQLNPKDYIAQTNIGRAYYIQENYPKAIEEYEKAVRMKSDYPDAHLGLGVVYYRDYHIDKAIDELHKAIELNPNYAEAYYNLGLIHLGEKNVEEAILKFKKAIQFDPNYDDAFCSLSVCYYQLENITQSIKYSNLALKINPYSGKAHNNLAVAYYGAGDLESAKKHLKGAKSMKYAVSPDFWDLLFNDQ